jgi:hypothetical protein
MQGTHSNKCCVLLNIRTYVSLFDLHGVNTADKLGKILLQEKQASTGQQNTHYTTKTKKFSN